MPDKEFCRWQVRSLTVLLALDTVEKLNQQLRNPQVNKAEEQGGLLLGRSVGEDSVEITDFEVVRSSHRRGVPYDLGPVERNRVDQRVRTLKRGDGPVPIGYFRTHLRPGLFLDQSDLALLTETFSEVPAIALALRPTWTGVPEAGIFFREEGDIDCTRPALRFPFDSGALKIQAPIELAPLPIVAKQAGPKPALWRPRRRAGVNGLVYGITGAILAVALVAGIHSREGRKRGEQTEAYSSATQRPAEGPARGGIVAPLTVFDDGQASSAKSDEDQAAIDGHRSPFEQPVRPSAAPPAPTPTAPTATQADVTETAPHFREVAREPAEQSAVVIPPSPPPPVVSNATTPTVSLPTASLPAAPSPTVFPPVTPPGTLVVTPEASAAATTQSSKNTISIDVSVEPKEGWMLKRIARRVPAVASHVPLLGRLPGLRHENEGKVVAARPDANLDPRIPAEVRRNLSEEVEVDIGATIDNRGVVRNTEIMKGDDTELSVLAADAVRSAQWRPARSGDRNVPMDVVVHYRFNPAREADAASR